MSQRDFIFTLSAVNLIERYSGYQKLLTLFKTKMAAAATDVQSVFELRCILNRKIIPIQSILTYDNIIVVSNSILYLHLYTCQVGNVYI